MTDFEKELLRLLRGSRFITGFELFCVLLVVFCVCICALDQLGVISFF